MEISSPVQRKELALLGLERRDLIEQGAQGRVETTEQEHDVVAGHVALMEALDNLLDQHAKELLDLAVLAEVRADLQERLDDGRELGIEATWSFGEFVRHEAMVSADPIAARCEERLQIAYRFKKLREDHRVRMKECICVCVCVSECLCVKLLVYVHVDRALTNRYRRLRRWYTNDVRWPMR